MERVWPPRSVNETIRQAIRAQWTELRVATDSSAALASTGDGISVLMQEILGFVINSIASPDVRLELGRGRRDLLSQFSILLCASFFSLLLIHSFLLRYATRPQMGRGSWWSCGSATRSCRISRPCTLVGRGW